MFSAKINYEGRMFARILAAFTIVIFVIVLVTSYVCYRSFEKIALDMVYTNQKENLSQLGNSAIFMADSVNALAKQIYFDSDVRAMIMNDPEQTNIMTGLDRLNLYITTIPNIDSIYVYNGFNKAFYYIRSNGNTMLSASNEFYDKDILKIIKNYRNYRKMTPISRVLTYPVDLNGHTLSGNVYTYMFYGLQGGNKDLMDAVVINISDEWLRSNINEMGSDLKDDILITQNDGNVVFRNGNVSINNNISNESYGKRILGNENDGYFVDSIDSMKYLVIYSGIPRYEWKIIRFIPYEEVVKQIVGLQKTIIIIGFVILVIGLLISYLVSKITFKPIDKALKDMTKLKEENGYTIKQKVMAELLKGHLEYPNDKITKITDYTKYDFSHPFILLLFKIDNYRKICDELIYENLKIDNMRVISDKFNYLGNNEIIDMNEGRFILVLNCESAQLKDDTQFMDKISGTARTIQDTILKMNGTSVSVLIGSTGYNASDLPALYIKACQSSLYRMYYGYGCILFEKDLEGMNFRDYTLSKKQEEFLKHQLLSAKLDVAAEKCSEIIDEASRFTYKSFHYTVIKIAMIICDAAEMIAESYERSLQHDYNRVLVDISQIETISEVKEYFDSLFNEIIDITTSKKNIRNEETIKTVVQYISKNYSDPNLTIYTLAENICISPGYLGRIFKKYTSTVLVDYITNVRIEKAKELLANSSRSVHDIIESVGLTNTTYFYSIFKKMTGMTPKEYRQSCFMQLHKT